jgi:hypothetical protein
MESLRERAAPTSEVEADAIGLVRSQGRYEPAPGRKQRVRARLLEHRIDDRRSRSRLLFMAPVVAVIVFAVGTSVALGRHWIARSYRAFAAQMRPDRDGDVARAARSPSAPAPAATVPPAPTAGETPQVPDSIPESAAAPPLSASGHARSPVEGSARAAGHNERLVFEAMRALRQEGQPERASRLLDEYLRRYPDGALAEEALTLSIEAATARSDPRARDLASRYLAKYPNGRFRSAAERALARFSP